jgi:hypothetical protein
MGRAAEPDDRANAVRRLNLCLDILAIKDNTGLAANHSTGSRAGRVPSPPPSAAPEPFPGRVRLAGDFLFAVAISADSAHRPRSPSNRRTPTLTTRHALEVTLAKARASCREARAALNKFERAHH